MRKKQHNTWIIHTKVFKRVLNKFCSKCSEKWYGVMMTPRGRRWNCNQKCTHENKSEVRGSVQEHVLNEFHSFSIHGERGLGFLRTFLQRISTLDEGDYSIQVIHRFFKSVHLYEWGKQRLPEILKLTAKQNQQNYSFLFHLIENLMRNKTLLIKTCWDDRKLKRYGLD